jgi:hypothetical protein
MSTAIAPKLNGHRLDRLKPVHAWLEKNEARLAWKHPASTMTPEVRCYLVCGATVILTVHRDDHGWDLYVPSTTKNCVADSLDNAAIMIGHGCTGATP